MLLVQEMLDARSAGRQEAGTSMALRRASCHSRELSWRPPSPRLPRAIRHGRRCPHPAGGERGNASIGSSKLPSPSVTGRLDCSEIRPRQGERMALAHSLRAEVISHMRSELRYPAQRESCALRNSPALDIEQPDPAYSWLLLGARWSTWQPGSASSGRGASRDRSGSARRRHRGRSR